MSQNTQNINQQTMLYISAFALLAVVYGDSFDYNEQSHRGLSSDSGDTECENGVCVTITLLPVDADISTDCFTIASESIKQNGYKEIDFSMDYKPNNSYSCVSMPACEECTSIGKQAFKGSTLDRFFMPHTVNFFDEQAFKEIVTSTGDALEIVQLCNPTDSTYTEITKDVRWAEKNRPSAYPSPGMPL